MVAAIAALIVGIVFGLGNVVLNTFTKTCSSLSSGTSTSTSCA
jgi:pilus assembly protein Flp/PilA